MSEEKKSIISKITKKLLSFGKALLSFIVIFTIFIFLAYVLEVIMPDFSTTEYATWIVIGSAVIISAIIRYGCKYRISWWSCVICTLIVLFNISTIEQYTPDRLMFHHKMKEWKNSGKKEIALTELTDFEWERIITLDYYSDSIPVTCSELPMFCNISIPWIHDREYWTMAFIRKNKTVHLIRVEAEEFDLGGVIGGAECWGNIKERFQLVLINNDFNRELLKKKENYFVCRGSPSCLILRSEECIRHYEISN